MPIVKKIFGNFNLLRMFLGLIFLSAGIFRILNWQQATLEFSMLGINYAGLIVFTIAMEIIAGLLLIFNIETKKVLLALIIFLTTALLWVLMISGQNLINGIKELFFLDATPTDWFLHFTYLIVIIFLLLNLKRE